MKPGLLVPQDELDTPFQVLDLQGQLVGPLPSGLSDERLLHWYRTMWMTRFFSFKMVALQRQGRASTWIPGEGQEATSVGMATPLLAQDWLTCSPREVGSYFLKGVSPAYIAYTVRGFPPNSELGGEEDLRCMPLYFVIGSQCLQATGLAMAAKIRNENSVVVCGCGDGGSSEGDFSEALNFAGVYQSPLVMVVVNNGWAISVPVRQQSAGGRIARRGAGFGVPARLVDGNDILAVYTVMQEAVERARNGGGPTLIEALTYRMGPHSTADDPTRYRPSEDLAYWKARDPLERFRRFLLQRGTLDEASDKALTAEAEAEIAAQVQRAQDYPAPNPDRFLDNIYAGSTPRLERQRAKIREEGVITQMNTDRTDEHR